MIELKHVIYHYHQEKMQFSLSIKKQERVAILGPSGAGKSTLLNLIAGFICQNSGQIFLNGQNANDMNPSQRPIAMLFQENNLFTHLTVYQNIGLGLNPSLRLSNEQKNQLTSLANKVGLINQLNRYPHQLSGGQKQRVAITRCLLQERPILLLDEPFSSLDSTLRKNMLMLVDQICEKYQLTLLMVTHNMDDVQNITPRSIVIEKGHIVFDDATKNLSKNRDDEWSG